MKALKQLEYINNELAKGNTLTKICETIGIGRTTIRDRFIKEGYMFSKINNTYKYNKDGTTATKKQVKGQMGFFDDIHKSQPQYQSITKVNTEIQEFKNIKSDILELLEKKTGLLEMLENYESKTNIIDIPQLDIGTLPQELQRDITTKSIKLYAPIYEGFDKLCHSYSSIKKQDLVSLALLEFTNRYKK